MVNMETEYNIIEDYLSKLKLLKSTDANSITYDKLLHVLNDIWADLSVDESQTVMQILDLEKNKG